MLGLQGDTSYENWKYDKQANIVEVLEEFPSLKVNAELLLTQLPLLQPVSTRLFLSAHLSDSSVNLEGIFFLFLSQRFYSISSSQELYPGEVHVTVAVVRFTKRGKSAFIYIFVPNMRMSVIISSNVILLKVVGAQFITACVRRG